MSIADLIRIDRRGDLRNRIVFAQQVLHRRGQQRADPLQGKHPWLDPGRCESAQVLPGRVFQVFFGKDGSGKDSAFVFSPKPVSSKERIATKQLVGPLPRDDGFVIACPDPPAHVPFCDGQRVVERSLGVPSRPFEGGSVQFFFGQTQQFLFGAGAFCHQLGDVGLVVDIAVKCDRERFDRRLLKCRGKSQDGTAVDAARQIASDRNIRFQTRCHRVDQSFFDASNIGLGIRTDLVAGRELQIPPPSCFGNESIALSLHDQHVSRQNGMNTLECRGSWNHHLHHLVQGRLSGTTVAKRQDA